MNNRQRAAKAQRERMDAVTMARLKNERGHYVVPLRYLTPEERRSFLQRATSPLDA